MQYNDSYDEKIFSFANNINTVDGGTHLSGFRAAITRTINSYGQSSGLFKDVKSEPVSRATTFARAWSRSCRVKMPQPQFEGQTKRKLNSAVEGLVEIFTNEKLGEFFEQNPAVAKKIVGKAVDAARAREAARKARDDAAQGRTRFEQPARQARRLSEKDPAASEIYIVEGDSAGGTAKQGRDRRIQAILPLKGKILNVEKARFDKMLGHGEIQALITALGTGIGKDDFDITKLRYHKIILMTDADVDGSHIRTLLLTFFYRQMPELIERGSHLHRAAAALSNEEGQDRAVHQGRGRDDAVPDEEGDRGRRRHGRQLRQANRRSRAHSHAREAAGVRGVSGQARATACTTTSSWMRSSRRWAGRVVCTSRAGSCSRCFRTKSRSDASRAFLTHAGLDAQLEFDEEHNRWRIEVLRTSGNGRVTIDYDLATHVEFSRATELYRDMPDLQTAPFTVGEGPSAVTLSSRTACSTTSSRRRRRTSTSSGTRVSAR